MDIVSAWISFEANLKPMRLRTKYDNLISQTTFVNSLQSENEYFNSSNTVDISYYFLPFYKIPDSLFQISSSEMNNFLRKNKTDYKQEESRSMDFIFFPLSPSADDSTFVVSEINDIRSSLNSGEINDSTFALLNSDGFNLIENIILTNYRRNLLVEMLVTFLTLSIVMAA